MARGGRITTVEHESFLRYARYRWLWVGVALSGVVTAVYLLDNSAPRPGGGTAYGYTLGTIGTLLILWLALLGVRKRAITAGSWSLKGWTSAHVYLGLSLIFIGTLHTGFQFGWNVHTLAYVLMILVIASGAVGVVLYVRMPRRLSDNRGELTERQMLTDLESIDRQIEVAAQGLNALEAGVVQGALTENPVATGMIARLFGTGKRGATAKVLVRVTRGRGANDSVTQLVERRLQLVQLIRRHLRIKALLEAWLFVHVPVTFALIAALIAHIIAVFWYW